MPKLGHLCNRLICTGYLPGVWGAESAGQDACCGAGGAEAVQVVQGGYRGGAGGARKVQIPFFLKMALARASRLLAEESGRCWRYGG